MLPSCDCKFHHFFIYLTNICNMSSVKLPAVNHMFGFFLVLPHLLLSQTEEQVRRVLFVCANRHTHSTQSCRGAVSKQRQRWQWWSQPRLRHSVEDENTQTSMHITHRTSYTYYKIRYRSITHTVWLTSDLWEVFGITILSNLGSLQVWGLVEAKRKKLTDVAAVLELLFISTSSPCSPKTEQTPADKHHVIKWTLSWDKKNLWSINTVFERDQKYVLDFSNWAYKQLLSACDTESRSKHAASVTDHLPGQENNPKKHVL